ncbi:uncharacterized protein LOC105393457 [Plutella xylostella]|uniref:uncharacterized protein LOC105393457 n=1 Tax=Plutella xylostella TaxID=51655 RepID=UPI0020325BDE|nr:uncharacterized protein LOC105393457 [Plutella xylostella]
MVKIGSKMTEAWKTRIEIVKGKVETILTKIKKGETEPVDYYNLKLLNELFMKKTHIYMDKLTVEESRTYTEIQIEAKLLDNKNNGDPPVQHVDQLTSKLPKLELPRFNGDTLKWNEFWDRFKSSVDTQKLTKADKFSYLMASLDQEALAAIEGLDITHENYEIAVDILKDRFGKPGMVIDAHYEALLNLKSAHSPNECMNVFNEIEKHLRILKALGEDTNHNNLRRIILNKYPEDIIYELKMKVKVEEQSVDTIRKLLEQQITARVTTTKPLLSTLSFTNTTEKRQYPVKRKFPTPKVTPAKRKKRSLPCIFCDGEHFNDNCKQVVSVEDRKKKIIGRCFVCFKKDHTARDCKERRRCFYCGEIGKHNRALCNMAQKSTTLQTRSEKNKGTVLQTAIAQVRSKDGTLHKCRILLDSGSQRSYITKNLTKIIMPEIIETDHLMIYTFGLEQPKKLESPRVKIELVCDSGHSRYVIVNVVNFITQQVSCFDFRQYQFGQEIIPSDDGSMGGEINLLIGNDYYFTFIKNGKLSIEENLYLIETDFGWVFSGRSPFHQEHVLSVATYMQTNLPDNFGFVQPDLPIKEGEIKQLWELESIGIRDSPKTTNEEEALRNFNSTVTFEENRYHVKWPWVQYPPNLPSNYGLAVGRLTSLLRRLDKNTLAIYDDTIQEQESSGVIEKVKNAFENVQHPIHYLSHHCVVKKDSSTQLRIVYDASAKSKSTQSSLNECMYKGPLMLEDLTGLILRFRQHEIGILADIEKAFLQLGLQNEDRDVTRFLWVKDTTKEVTEDNLQCYRFCRVPFGIVSSPFLLNATIKSHFLKCGDETLKNVAEKIYVDNLVLGAKQQDEATGLYQKIHASLQTISMNVRQWNSNNKEFLKEIPEHLLEGKEVTKVLGLVWDTLEDTLKLKTQISNCDRDMTKRYVLQEIASIYDPCGFSSPLLLPAKEYLQRLWKLKLKWDTKLPEDLRDEWNRIASSLHQTQDIEIPRYIGATQDNAVHELHCFTDASKDAYAAAVYIKTESQDKVIVRLLMSKSKLTPLKDQDNLQIPRLELLGTLIGSRLLRYVRQHSEVPISKQYLWTDSQVVISWLRSEKLLPPFISRRVTEINKQDTQVLYVKSADNPADIATRVADFTPAKRELWFEGPQFLKNEREYKNNWAMTQNLCALEGLTQSEGYPENESTENEDGPTLNEANVNPESLQLQQSEETITNITAKIKREQKLHYPQECAGKSTDLSRSLGVFKDENGLLRCRGRIVLTDLPYDRKYPILLPKDSSLTEEIISNIHKDNYHIGVTHTLSLIREKYWIPQGRCKVQKALKKCLQCRKYGGGPYRLPQMPDLPEERVNFTSAFSFIGLDYLGPLLVTTDKGQTEKRWICLYTCLAVRAIHLEIVKDLTAEQCTLALRRFIAERGLPRLIISDNAAQFKLTAEVMAGPYCIDNNLQWKFIPELAPWHGGFYERLVGLVKHCMKRSLDTRLLRDNELSTIVKEIELVLNTRPLTYVGAEHEHIILKPLDFLRMNVCLMQTSEVPYESREDTITKELLIKGWKRSHKLVDEFRKMFINQYLNALKERTQIRHKQPRVVSQSKPKVGDVVQIKGDNNNRSTWKIGKIILLHRGRDNEVRVATVKVGDKEYIRSIAHLFPLEIEEHEHIEKEHVSTRTESDCREETETLKTTQETEMEGRSVDMPTEIETVEPTTDRSNSRAAARRAKEKIAQWTKELVNLICVNCIQL